MAGDPIDLDVFDDESYSTEPIWDLSDEEDEESEEDLLWEREFADELEGLPVDEEVGTFDPEGDLAYLEALLAGNPMTDLKQEEVVVEEEEHHSWPVVLIANARKSSKQREKAMRRTPGIVFQWLLPGSNMYHSYSISIRVILELLIRFQAFIKHVSQCQSRSRMKCYTIELDWTRVLEHPRELNQLSPFQIALVFFYFLFIFSF
ncbi:hypothetical protein HanIR_Chr05g0222531 [Helianthus annuus]|nr:hypothetical protein HanIR_Chr05g0222531 [Helianthus annuus]